MHELNFVSVFNESYIISLGGKTKRTLQNIDSDRELPKKSI